MNLIKNSDITKQLISDSVDHTTEAKTTIANFPAELLLHIFQFCYEDFKEEETSQPSLSEPPWHYISSSLEPLSMRPSSASDLFERYRSPSRFPFSLAAVSPFWNDLLLLQPKYWTEFIFFLGPVSNPSLKISEVSRRLKFYPRDIPIDFIVLGEKYCGMHDLETQGNTIEEQIHMDDITDHLCNRFPQCRSLSFEIGESFPDIAKCLSRPAFERKPILSSMLLTQEMNDSHLPSRPSIAGTSLDHRFAEDYPFDDYEFDGLQSLFTVGNYLDSFIRAFPNNKEYKLEQLVITDYKYSEGGIQLEDLLTVMQGLHYLRRLKLQNVEFGHKTEILQSFICYATHLHLENISPFMMDGLFKRWLSFSAWMESIHLTKCHVSNFIYTSDCVVLDDPELGSLASKLPDWSGRDLWIGRLRGSGDDFLNMIGIPKVDSSTGEEDFACPFMEKLQMYQIPDISLLALRRFIENRNRGLNCDDPEWRIKLDAEHPEWPGPAIMDLVIDQCGIEPLTKEDVEWFSSHLNKFVYIQ